MQVPVRRAVRHAAFEGPLSAHLVENPEAHLDDENPESPGWAAYVSSLDRFRKDLKQIHMLEEEMSRVRRDREILVTRLIKSTKSRPKKADLTAMSQEYGQHRSPSSMSSRASTISLSSVGSFGTKESKRANKLAEAQAELLGCEEHLRGLEVRIESERNQVMSRGLEERFRAMEAVGRMWVRQSRRGLDDLEKIHGEPSSHLLTLNVADRYRTPPGRFRARLQWINRTIPICIPDRQRRCFHSPSRRSTLPSRRTTGLYRGQYH